jgi:hypothetical protein
MALKMTAVNEVKETNIYNIGGEMNISKNQSRTLVILAVFIALGVVIQLLAAWLLPSMKDIQGPTNIFLFSVLKGLEHSAISLFINIGACVALFLLARSKKLFCFIWAFLGLVLGIMGVILFFVVELYEQKNNQPTE